MNDVSSFFQIFSNVLFFFLLSHTMLSLALVSQSLHKDNTVCVHPVCLLDRYNPLQKTGIFRFLRTYSFETEKKKGKKTLVVFVFSLFIFFFCFKFSKQHPNFEKKRKGIEKKIIRRLKCHSLVFLLFLRSKINSLSQLQLVAIIDCTANSSHVLFPRVRSRFSTSSSFFFSSKSQTNLSSTCSSIHIHKSTV
jgi:hypothetical protein